MLYKIKKPEYVKKGIVRLIAIADELKLYKNDGYLKNRLTKNIDYLHKYAKGREEDSKKLKKQNLHLMMKTVENNG